MSVLQMAARGCVAGMAGVPWSRVVGAASANQGGVDPDAVSSWRLSAATERTMTEVREQRIDYNDVPVCVCVCVCVCRCRCVKGQLGYNCVYTHPLISPIWANVFDISNPAGMKDS